MNYFSVYIYFCAKCTISSSKHIYYRQGGWGDGRKQFRDALVVLADYKFRCAKRSKMRSKTLHL